VLCIEHHQGILACADYLVELGPGAGPDGGTIVREGAPERA
jgi:excinuclease UvrABC ATPase subunit